MRAKQVHEDLAVGIGSSGRGGVGNNNMITPQSQGAFAHQEEIEEREREQGDLDLGDLKGEFFNESLNFEQGGDPYKKLKLGKYHQPIVNDSIIKINRDIQTVDYKNEDVFLEKGDILIYQDPIKWESYNPIETPYFYTTKPTGKTYILGSKITQWFLNHPEVYEYMGSDSVSESLNFEQGGNPIEKLGIGSHRPRTVTFKDWQGTPVTIEIKNDTFILDDTEIRLKFYDGEDGFKGAHVYIDGELQENFSAFTISPAPYEFFVPSGNNDGLSAYGFPLVDKNDIKGIKDMEKKYETWLVGFQEEKYHRSSKDPFIAVAQLVLYLY